MGAGRPSKGAQKVQEKCAVDFPAGRPADWPSGTRPDASALGEYVGGFSEVASAVAAGRPTLIYYYSRQTVDGKSRQLTKQAMLCRQIDATLFDGAEIAIGTLSRFFARVKMDVTSVAPSANPILNNQTAPAAVVVGHDGKVVSSLVGRIDRRSLAAAMLTALVRAGLVKSDVVSRATAALKLIEKLENQKEDLKRQKGAQAEASIAAVTKALEDAYRAYESIMTPLEPPKRPAFGTAAVGAM